MNSEEIIEMAREAGMELYGLGKNRARFVYHLEAFAKRVAAKEREACAELRNKFHPFDLKGRQEIIGVMNSALDDYQAAIKAKGQA
jgi:hypothetical protein